MLHYIWYKIINHVCCYVTIARFFFFFQLVISLQITLELRFLKPLFHQRQLPFWRSAEHTRSVGLGYMSPPSPPWKQYLSAWSFRHSKHNTRSRIWCRREWITLFSHPFTQRHGKCVKSAKTKNIASTNLLSSKRQTTTAVLGATLCVINLWKSCTVPVLVSERHFRLILNKIVKLTVHIEPIVC